MSRIKKVLILSVSAGEGHMRAAEAVKAAVNRLHPEAEVTVLDTFRYASPFMEKIVLGTYMEILKMSPVVYGYLYKQAEKSQPLSGFAKTEFNRILNRFAAPKLVAYIKRIKPQAILCTHPFPLGIISLMKEKGEYSGPLLAAITDFTVHPFWIFPDVDCYLLAAGELAQSFQDYHYPPGRTKVTGIPIDPSFAEVRPKAALRQKWGLQSEVPAILVMGGGLGMGPLENVVKSLDTLTSDCQLVVVTGRNQDLREKLEHLQPDFKKTVKILGYVNCIEELMAGCDLMVGKAGGLTSAEAMASGLPMLIIDPIPGQEERNADFLQSCGAARKIKNGEDLLRQVQRLLFNPQFLTEMSALAAELGRPGAAYTAVKVIEASLQDGSLGGGPLDIG